MLQRKFWLSAFLVLVFVGSAKADSITLTVKAWTYTSSGAADGSVLTIVATNSSGKEIAFAATFPNSTFVGFPNTSQAMTALGVSPFSSLSAIAISPVGASNSVFSLAASHALPAGLNGVANVSIGFTGSLKVYAGTIASPSNPNQPLTTTLSFSLVPGIGVYALSLAGAPTLTLTGTGGTLTIDQTSPLTPVPEPATLLMFGSGLLAMGLKARRKR